MTAHAAPIVPRHPASTYNCYTNPQTSSGHCYGQVAWWGDSSQAWTAAKMDMTVESMTCSESGCNSANQNPPFDIESALWLADKSTWAQQHCLYGACWVETGTITYYDSFFGAVNIYVWGDNRPCNGKFNFHFGNLDTYEQGNTDTFQIQLDPNSTFPTRNCNNKATSWNLTTTDPVHGSMWSGLPNVSTNNPMQPWEVVAGMELFGSMNESSNNTVYSRINKFDSGQWWDLSTFGNGDGYSQQSPIHSWYTLPGPGNVWYWDAYCAPSISGGGPCTPFY